MKLVITIFTAAMLCISAAEAQDISSEHARKFLEIYTKIIGMETLKGLGNVPDMANYLAGELRAAGFLEQDVEVVPLGETASLIARYRGISSSTLAPVLLLGHMDVVEADPADWERRTLLCGWRVASSPQQTTVQFDVAATYPTSQNGIDKLNFRDQRNPSSGVKQPPCSIQRTHSS